VVGGCAIVGGATRPLRIEEEHVLRIAVICSIIVSLKKRRTPRTLREETFSASAMSGLDDSGKRLFRPWYMMSSLVLDGWINILYDADQFPMLSNS